MNVFTRNIPYYHLIKYLLFLLKHPVCKEWVARSILSTVMAIYCAVIGRCTPFFVSVSAMRIISLGSVCGIAVAYSSMCGIDRWYIPLPWIYYPALLFCNTGRGRKTLTVSKMK
jgi:hypothetical protein